MVLTWKYCRLVLLGIMFLSLLRARASSQSGDIAMSGDVATPGMVRVNLREEERVWLESHPDIALGYTDAFEPEVIVNPDGSLRGIQVDILNQLNSRLGTQIRLQIDPVAILVEKAKKREVDGILSLHPDYADELGLLKTRSIFTNYPAVFARMELAFNSYSALAGKRVAIIDKVFFSEQLVAQHGQGATVLKVLNAEEGPQFVQNGQADFFFGATLNAYLITKYQLFDVAAQHVFHDHPIDSVIGTRSDWPELSSILDKGLSSFSKEEIEAITAKWNLLSQQLKPIGLTSEEQDWIKAHAKIVLGGGIFPPHDFVDPEGNPTGIGSEYTNLISDFLRMRFEYISGDWTDIHDMVKKKEIDGVRLLVKNPEREQYLNFSNPYVSFGYAIIIRKDRHSYLSLLELAGKKVSVMETTHQHHSLRDRYPEISLVLFDSDEDGLTALLSNDGDVHLGTYATCGYIILLIPKTNDEII
jgi:ABC-type amino acid transport substrate-binding protein